MSGKSLLMSMEDMQKAQLLDLWVLICHKLQNGSQLEFNFRNILLFKYVDTSGNASKCSGFEFPRAED